VGLSARPAVPWMVPVRAAAVALGFLTAALSLAGPATAATRRAPTPMPAGIVVDGPSSDIVGLDGLSVARDGTGAVVYLRTVGGVAHVYVSLLSGGTFSPPVEIDAGMLGASSQPVIAAGNGGIGLVGFINGGALYVVQTTAGGAFTAPQLLYRSAANPSISMSNFGKAYLAFTATDGAGGGDVRAAYYYQGVWGLEPTPLDDNPVDQAGTGAGRPDVATAGDGIAIVAWGENGHIFTRRVIKTAASTVDEQADVASLDGWTEVSAGEPMVATGGDDTTASVVYQEQITGGGSQQSRVLFSHLRGSRYDETAEVDGASTGGPEGAIDPETQVTEYGHGWVVSSHDQTHELYAATLGGSEAYENALRVDSAANSTDPDAMPGIAGLTSTFIVWQQDPGAVGPAEIRLRFAADGADLGPEQVISSPTLGPTDAGLGLFTGGDVEGDAVVAWVQGAGSATRIVAQLLLQPPGGFSPTAAFRYATTRHPVLAWSAPAERMSPLRYTVYVDGIAVAQTGATEVAVPSVIADGRHTWHVTATNQAGEAVTTSVARLFVDTVAPKVSVTLPRIGVAGQPVDAILKDRDVAPADLPRGDASGVKTVTVRWGDGTIEHLTPRSAHPAHVFTRGRTYTVTVTVTDRAGNARVVKRRLRIV
jgi:hypothetical protein